MPERILAITAAPEALRGLADVADVAVHADAAGWKERAEEHPWALVLVDSGFAGDAGGDIASDLASRHGHVVLMARIPSLHLTRDALEAGVADVVAFPPDPERLALHLSGAVSGAPLPVVPLAGSSTETDLVGNSAEMLDVFRTVARIASGGEPTLIVGEAGTGKRTIAAALHRYGARAGEPLVELSCAALPEALLESELFGHEAGTLPWAVARRRGRLERADGGTLFLDHVDDLSPRLQMKLLQVLREGTAERVGGAEPVPVDVRVIAAAKRDPSGLVERGEFLDALHHALGTVALRLPPLRDRDGDVLLLACHFAALAAARHGRPVEGISRDVARRLEEHDWPGNARELRSVMERAVLMADGPVLELRHLPDGGSWPTGPARESGAGGGMPIRTSLEEVEADHIRRVLQAMGGNLSQTAEILQIHRNTLRRKLRRYGISS